MLVLSRKLGESVVIDGRIKIKIVRVDGDTVKIGIDAPPDVPVHRQEVYDEIQQNNKQAARAGRSAVPKLKPQEGDSKTFSDRASAAGFAAA